MQARQEVIDPLQDARWVRLLERAPDASIFHHPTWLAVLYEQYGFQIWGVAVARDDGELAAGLPLATVCSRLTGRRLVTLPFSDIVGPVLGDAPQTAREQLWQAVEAERRARRLPLEVHAHVPELIGGRPGDRFLHHVVDLTGVADPGRGLVVPAKRRQVRRATELGVRVERRTDRHALETFFALHVLTRHKHGLPTQPKGFFLRLEALFDRGLGFVLCAERDGRPLAASVYLCWRDVMTMKYNASDPAHLRNRANALLYRNALDIACGEGRRTLDYGRTELDNEGLDRYKRTFGAERHELSYTLVAAGTSRRSVRSVSRLQRAAIRRAPPFVGRAIGAAAYRHFA